MADAVRILLREFHNPSSKLHQSLINCQTSKPVPTAPKPAGSETNMNSFHRYYNFNFASLDCVAFGDACAKHDINAFPTFMLYKDSKFVKKFSGKKEMEGLSAFVEETLESIRQG